MTFKIVTDLKSGKSERVAVAADDLQQDTPEQHAAKMAAPRPLQLAERVALLETQVAALTAARAPVK